MKFLLLIVISAVMFSCAEKPAIVEKYKEEHRPQYHFTPDHNWTNDPNGLVYFAGQYHLYYQYNPYANRWGHMSWGHATSTDLLHWNHQPVAIEEYTDANGDSVMIFSGSAVVDGSGISAIYTSHVHKDNQGLRQHQSIAHSSDNGKTFKRYENNPVIDIGRKDFRDPKVFWYGPQQKWVMAAVVPDKFKVQLYGSKDLKKWDLLSEFGPLGDTAKIWECPDLFQVAMENDPTKKKWVMLVSNSHPQGPTYVGMQYFIGEFDGTKFTADQPSQYPLYLDYGKDFYAAVTYNNVPDGRRILQGWVNNWAYANDLPTEPWKGAMSLPRELYLYDDPKQGLRLKQVPIAEIQSLKSRTLDEKDSVTRSLHLEVTISPLDTVGVVGFKLFGGAVVGYDAVTSRVFVDRREGGNTSFHKTFPSYDDVKVRRINGKVILSVYVDQSMIEVFINGGEATITELFFPKGNSKAVEIWGDLPGGSIIYNMSAMKSVWE